MKPLHVLALCIACTAGTTAIAASKLTPDTMTDKARQRPVTPKSPASAILRAQVMLDRAHFTSGEIDAAYGQNLRTAIKGFQKANDLPDSGIIDKATWAVLNTDQEPILLAYTIEEADVAGPFLPIPADWSDKAAMKALGFTSAIEGLGEKFHASPKLLSRLNPGKKLDVAGTEIMVPNIAAASALPKAAKIIVDESDQTLSLVDAKGKTIAQFPATMGSEHDPLPVGRWKVTGVGLNPVFHYNPKLFWDAEPGDTKVTIPAGPNNPVGVAWIDLSKPHYGIHGTPEPSGIGKTQSHGCIRLTNWDANTLAQSVAKGVEVLLQQ
jgi:lipoprotein-anchoring transpeptidase ErfK/SrfK